MMPPWNKFCQRKSPSLFLWKKLYWAFAAIWYCGGREGAAGRSFLKAFRKTSRRSDNWVAIFFTSPSLYLKKAMI
jgi:hypothetical protein